MKKQIPTPCSKDWETMKSEGEGLQKFCSTCQSDVYDITNLSEDEISELYEKMKGNLCVRATRLQLNDSKSKVFRIKRLIKKVGIVCFIILTTSIGQQLNAQLIKKPDTYKLQQENTDSKLITISGVVKGERWIGWKKLEAVTVKIFSEEGMLLTSFETAADGTFETKMPLKLIGEKYSIRFNAFGYKTMKVTTVETKDTKIKVYLEDREMYFVTGRFF